ncbi:hypothetical protein ABT324_30890 [Saccharopolyspora sp. NPDC000359]|uniref:hypothetical protein n=1 Tax=Saccharopolyspora sp. NPDC000359 TaxID=3154251 RepID=UPI00333108F0
MRPGRPSLQNEHQAADAEGMRMHDDTIPPKVRRWTDVAGCRHIVGVTPTVTICGCEIDGADQVGSATDCTCCVEVWLVAAHHRCTSECRPDGLRSAAM